MVLNTFNDLDFSAIADKKGMNAVACAMMSYDDEIAEMLKEAIKR